MESSYFNPDVGQYEPLLEPWEIVMKVEQQLPFLALFVTMVSDKMINLNLTYGSTLCFKKIMQKTDFNAIEEEKVDNQKDHEAFEEEGFMFWNQLGIDFYIMVEDWEKVRGKVILSKRLQEYASFKVFANSEQFISKKNIISILRQIRLQKNDGKIVESMEDKMLTMDVVIEGFEAVRKVPIEIKGQWSYSITCAND